MSILFRQLFTTAIFSRFSKVAIATSNFMKEFYNGGFAPEVTVSMLKETIALVRDYVSKTRKYKAKLAEKALSTGEPCTCGYVCNQVHGSTYIYIYIYVCVCVYVCMYKLYLFYRLVGELLHLETCYLQQ